MSLGPVTKDHPAPQSQDWGRRRLRSGAAKVALDITRKGLFGEGLRAAAMAQGTSEHNLERMAKGRNPSTIGTPTLRHCLACSRAGRPDPWHPPGASCPRLVWTHG